MEKVGLKSFCLVNVHLQLKAEQHNYQDHKINYFAQEQAGLQRGPSLYRRPPNPCLRPPPQHGRLYQEQIFKVAEQIKEFT